MPGGQTVKDRLGRYLLADGKNIVIDLGASKGSWLVDRAKGDRYLDCFSMVASMAIGYNHDRLLAAAEELGRIAINKPANSNISGRYLRPHLIITAEEIDQALAIVRKVLGRLRP